MKIWAILFVVAWASRVSADGFLGHQMSRPGQRLLKKNTMMMKRKKQAGRPTGGRALFLQAGGRFDLGTVELPNKASFVKASQTSIKNAAANTLKRILRQTNGATGREIIRATDENIPVDQKGNRHIRFNQFIEGKKVDGASLMIHFNRNGRVLFVNGEFVSERSIDPRVKLTCLEAMGVAVGMTNIDRPQVISQCKEGAVRGYDGNFHPAYTQVIGFQPRNKRGKIDKKSSYQRVMVYASKVDGSLLAQHPLSRGAVAVETYTCSNTVTNCVLVVNATSRITDPDKTVMTAHNHAIDTYYFYFDYLGRNSIDNKGMALVNNVHYDAGLVNAFWDGFEMYYGDGDGVNFGPFSYALDVCAHELTHGVTQYASNLIYENEPGAINEAISDMFGASVERIMGNKSITDTWLLGEDLYIVPAAGQAARNMADPKPYGQVDYYPEKYTGTDDYGGVHNNSGIANLAFALMVQGGVHPRNKTTNKVVPLKPKFDDSILVGAKIMYSANTACLTPSATFASLRACTESIATTLDPTGGYLKSVSGAWDAVGVGGGGGGDSNLTVLSDSVALTGQKGAADTFKDYALDGVKKGETVTCWTYGGSGDTDMYVRFAQLPNLFPSNWNDCQSINVYGTDNACTTAIAPADASAYMSTYALEAYSNVSVMCYRSKADIILEDTPMYHKKGDAGTTYFYVLDGIFYGDTVTCSLDPGTNGTGDADLYMRFGTLPTLLGNEYDCASTTGTSKEKCQVKFNDPAYSAYTGISVPLFVLIYGNTAFKELTLKCMSDRVPFSLSAGIAMEDIADNRFGVIEYLLKGVKNGQKVNCTTNGANGDADLYMKFGSPAEPFFWSFVNDCESYSPKSNETCAAVASSNTDAYIAIHAFQAYDTLTLECKIS